MKTIAVLKEKNGGSVGLGVALAMLLQMHIMSLSSYLSNFVVKSNLYMGPEGTSDISFKDGVTAPLAGLVATLLVVELLLWVPTLVNAVKKGK